ncbi:MAG: histidine kinase dimerization/phosphoacceptor domain -containing protein [Deltaproteobacteria bacterium]
MNINIVPASFMKRLLLGFSVLLILFLVFMITTDIAGVPGTANKGRFDTYRARTLNDMDLVSGLLGRRISNWVEESRADVSGLTASLLLRRAIERRTAQSDKELAGELKAFLSSNKGIASVAILDPGSASIRAGGGGFTGARNASDIAITPDKLSRLIIPGYLETIEIHHPADKKIRLRIFHQVLSTYMPERIMAVLVAEINVEKMLRPLIWSVSSDLSRDWKCIIAIKSGGIFTEFGEKSTVADAQRENISNIESFAPISLAISGIDGPYDGPDQDGRPVLAFHRQVRIDRGIALALVLKVDRMVALKPARADFSRQIILWLFLFIIGIGLCIFLARQISLPVNELTDVARRIESGDLTARTSAPDQSEIGRLASVFNGMIARLQTWHQDMEKQILDRTLDLRTLSARQNAILTTVPDIIMEVDTNRIYTWSNRAGFEFFGEDVIGKEAAEYFVGEQETYDVVQPVYEVTEKVIYIESQQRRKDGAVRLLAWRCKAIGDEHGTVTGLLLTARDITDIRRAEDRIKASLREKDILLNEIHHRVKNNMQVISSLLKLQASACGNPELTERLNESQSRIHAMALVHEKLYGSKDFSRIDLAGYVRTLSQELFQSHKINQWKIALIVQTDGEVHVDVNKAIPCGLILNELISNALKHAFPGGRQGKLQIIIRETENKEIEIAVRDNGLGLPDDVDIHKPRSLGLDLVNGLVKNQLDGQIEVRRDKGTEFRITFPL